MKIWLDTQNNFQSLPSIGSRYGLSEASPARETSIDYECTEECYEECAEDCSEGVYNEAAFSLVHMWQQGEAWQPVKASLLQLATPLYMQPCTPDTWLACLPTGRGKVVVLDAQGKSLLELFRIARSVDEVISLMKDVPAQTIAVAVGLLYSAGLLQNALEPVGVQTQGRSQTLSAWLHVTNACNLRCQYCYLEKTSESMKDETALRAIDAIFRSAQKQGFKRVKLRYAGGEATLIINRVLAIHDYAMRQAQACGIRCQGTILSNGVVLSSRVIKQLQARHIGVMISLDSIGALHDSQRPFKDGQGSFKYVERTIGRLLDHGLVPGISITVTRHNLEGLPELISYLLERDLPFGLNYYRDNDCVTDHQALQFEEQQMITAMRRVFKVIEQQLPRRSLLGSLIDKANLSYAHHHSCGVGRNYMVIDQEGGVAKCHAAIKQTVTTIDVDDPLRMIQNDVHGVQNPSVDEREGCHSCQWRYWCAGGCPLLTYRMNRRYDRQSPNCHIYKALFPDALHIEALRLLKYRSPIILTS